VTTLEHDPVATEVLRSVLREARKEYHGANVEYVEGSDPMEWRVTVAGETRQMIADREWDYDGMLRAMASALKYALRMNTRHGFKKRKRR
jgi:hypothetical protein